MTKILVIEDETLLRNEVMEWLTMEDYEAFGAVDGVEGVNLAIHHLPDVILCDIAMPQLDGYDVMLDIRANSLTQLTPFIYMTARTSLDDIRRGMALGADDYTTKPFTRKQLLQAVQARLEKKALQEQIEIEQWRQALETEHEQRLLKSKMVAMFSHDFRNPLTSIMSCNGLLRDYGNRMDEERRQNYFNRVEGSVRRLLQMLDDMLAIAQLESGNLDFEREEMNVSEFLKQIVEEFQLVNAETYSIIFKSDFHDLVMVNLRLLRQIAVNLISNAIKYSPQGGEVCVSLQHIDQHMILRVQDHGIGIPEVDQSRLFNAFQRASNVGSVSGGFLWRYSSSRKLGRCGNNIHS
jgi:two-component system, sensor histidine kinase and response regulator